jgi:hypothetical protein
VKARSDDASGAGEVGDGGSSPDVGTNPLREVARTAPALEIRGLLERYQGVTNVLARRIVALPLGLTDLLRSRDFHEGARVL